jgi:flagellar motor switch protein FliN/FliY
MSEEPRDNSTDTDGVAPDEPVVSGATPEAASKPEPGVEPTPSASAARPLDLPELTDDPDAPSAEGIDLLSDVNVNVRIELGRTEMLVEDVLRLGEGAVVELDKLAGDPVDIFVNDRPVARGEVLVLNDNFCVRVNEILSPNQKRGAGKGAKQAEEPRAV